MDIDTAAGTACEPEPAAQASEPPAPGAGTEPGPVGAQVEDDLFPLLAEPEDSLPPSRLALLERVRQVRASAGALRPGEGSPEGASAARARPWSSGGLRPPALIDHTRVVPFS